MRHLLTASVCIGIAAASLLSASAAPLVSRPVTGAETLVVPVQGRACRTCRRDCYADYRVGCGYSQSCRSAFTQCMRGCWEDYCR